MVGTKGLPSDRPLPALQGWGMRGWDGFAPVYSSLPMALQLAFAQMETLRSWLGMGWHAFFEHLLTLSCTLFHSVCAHTCVHTL
eukprot:357492-Chlamydomonas_euryale.AAC.6